MGVVPIKLIFIGVEYIEKPNIGKIRKILRFDSRDEIKNNRSMNFIQINT